MEKIWLSHYVAGVPADIDVTSFRSIPDLFAANCQQFRDRPAFYNLGVTLTYQQIDAYSRDFAAYLQQELGLKKGDRVALMMPNLLQYPIAMLGILRAGLVVVNVNPLYTATELTHQLQDAGAETIIVLENFVDTVQAAQSTTPLKNIIVTQLGDLFPFIKAAAYHFVLKYIKKKIPTYSFEPSLSFKKALQHGRQLSLTPVDVQPDDIAFLQYTGGTTGVSKAAVLMHRNIVANILQAEAWFKPQFEYGKEIILTALPLYHIFSLTANCLFLSKIGGLNILITNPRDIDSIIKEMKKFKITVITGVNTMFNSLLKHPEFPQCQFDGIKMTLGGGMSVQRAIAMQWQAVTGRPILQAYGLTETSPCVSINPTGTLDYNGTVGMPVSSTDIRILNSEGNELGIGQAGEIAIKGPQVMKEYWNNPYETSKVFTADGWLLTGDIASIDEKGYITILERKKDMILVSGFNVYPNEIEDVLVSMPGIREVAVIGVPDENSGEIPKAFIVRDDLAITAEDVKKFCHAHLTGYKIPKQICFCDELPKSNVGKVLRRALKEKVTSLPS